MNSNNTAATRAIQRSVSEGMHIVTFPRPSFQEFFINVVPTAGETHEAMFQRTGRALTDADSPCAGARIVSLEIFGVRESDGAGYRMLEAALGPIEWPVTWLIDGDKDELAGIQIWAVSGVEIHPVRLDKKIVGNVFEDEYCRYCRLGGMLPDNLTETREVQTRRLFTRMEAALLSVGMDFTQVLRTWFYNHDLLDWYFGFNKVRDGFFAERGVYNCLVPSSTGIGATNPVRAALVAELIAIDPRTSDVRLAALPSPLQCTALDYGSSFSRASELSMPDHRRIFISGTASIEPGGKTVHLEDMDAQVDLTMRVAHAILESRDMDWRDVTRAIAYIRRAEDAPAYARYCQTNNLPEMPTVVCNNVVCRDDLLFEIELDAIKLT